MERGCSLSQLRSHRFHHTVINNLCCHNSSTIPPCVWPLRDGISALRLWSLSLPEGAVWAKVKYAPPSLGCWALIRQCPVASCPQHECACKQACSTSVLITSPCVSKVTKTQELCQGFECVAKPVVSTYEVPPGGIKMSTPFEGLNSLKQLQMYPLNKYRGSSLSFSTNGGL